MTKRKKFSDGGINSGAHAAFKTVHDKLFGKKKARCYFVSSKTERTL
jgi:hypothetical protein